MKNVCYFAFDSRKVVLLLETIKKIDMGAYYVPGSVLNILHISPSQPPSDT